METPVNTLAQPAALPILRVGATSCKASLRVQTASAHRVVVASRRQSGQATWRRLSVGGAGAPRYGDASQHSCPTRRSTDLESRRHVVQSVFTAADGKRASSRSGFAAAVGTGNVAPTLSRRGRGTPLWRRQSTLLPNPPLYRS